MELELEQAIAAADHAIARHTGRHLSDIETKILKGAWQGLTYDQIADAAGYSDSYVRRNVGVKFWRVLSQALGETVSKTSFRESLRRYLKQQENIPMTPTQNIVQGSDVRPELNRPSTNEIPDVAATNAPAENSLLPARYVERPPTEQVCFEALLQPGALVRIKAPALMGKTQLMEYTLDRLAAQDLRTAFLSFELADRHVHFSNLDRFLRWLCINLSLELGLPNAIDDYWDEAGVGSKVSCTNYIEQYLLASSDRPLVLCLDDVDLLFPYPDIYADVFGLLRSWHEKARRRKRWQQMRLCIVHATDVYIQLNINQSPFNVGIPIELPDFTLSQAQMLANQYGVSADVDIPLLMEWIGGHPYLLELTFESLKRLGQPLDQLLKEAPTEAGIFASHLREHWLGVRDNPDLRLTLHQVMSASQSVPIESVHAYQLQRMGVIRLQGNLAEPRCRLYRSYFITQLAATLIRVNEP
ncbi:MAG: AAA-like domain-containing protein [Cyanobacteria bacterium J06627_8]